MVDNGTSGKSLSTANKNDMKRIKLDDEGDGADVYRDCTTTNDILRAGSGVRMAKMLRGFVLTGPDRSESKDPEVLDESVDRQARNTSIQEGPEENGSGIRRREGRRRRAVATIRVPRASTTDDESCDMNGRHIPRGCDRPWNRPSKAFCDCMYPPVVVEHPITVDRQIETYRGVIGR